MSLSQAYERLDGNTAYPQCKTCRWYETLEPADREFFDKTVSNPKVRLGRLLRACREEGGLNVAESSFRTHVRAHAQGFRS